MSFHYKNFVQSSTVLQDGDRFVSWRMAKGRKMPFNPVTGYAARSDDPATWSNRPAAERHAKANGGGVGVMFGDLGNGFWLCGLDLDSCLDDSGQLADWALEMIGRFATRAEISPSGKGVKLYFIVSAADRAAMGTKHRVQFAKGDHCEAALDFGGRYYAMTDRLLELPLMGVFENLRILPLADLRWFVLEAGPAFEGRRRKSSTRDDSDSAVLFRLAWRMKSEGKTFDDFRAAIDADERAAAHVAKEGDRAAERAWARAPEPPDRTAAFDDLVGTPPADPITARVNEQWALVRHGGRTLAAQFRDGVPELGSVEDMHKWFASDGAPTGRNGAREEASRYWLRNPRRREYDEIVFDPSGKASRRALNLWTGWAVKPDWDGSCELILRHVRDVLADGDPERERYILGWLADLVQNPGRKPDVALVLTGGKGAGKDTLAVIFKRIIGNRHVAHVDNPVRLTSRFNAAFGTSLLIHVEDTFWAGAKGDKGTLQALITSPTATIERKGIDAVTVASFVRLLMTANRDQWTAPASADERRYAIFDVSDARMGDRDYFRALYHEIDHGGAEAFLASLLMFDLDGFDPRDVPQTEALRDQKLESLDGIERWWFDILSDGNLGSAFEDWEDAPIEVERDRLRVSYEAFTRDHRQYGPARPSGVFGKRLKKMLPALAKTRPREDGSRRRECYVLPTLAECRTAFETHLKASVDWGAE